MSIQHSLKVSNGIEAIHEAGNVIFFLNQLLLGKKLRFTLSQIQAIL